MNLIFRHVSICLLIATLSGCSSIQTVSPGTYKAEALIWEAWLVEDSRRKTYKEANAKCAAMGQGMDPVREGRLNKAQFYWVLEFRCYDRAQRAAEERAKRVAAQQEAERQRRIKAEQDRQAELEKQRRAEEWELGRPQREAEARAAQARERSRLNGICPIYYVARQSCANSGNGYQQCMTIRVGRSYSSWDDSTCFNR
jgi:hypothetical protein